MAETYDSVLDRIGAFNLATESLAKGRVTNVEVTIAGRPELGLRLVKTAENYRIEVSGAAGEAAAALDGMHFKAEGGAYVREVRKSERSWNVASEVEDVLEEALGLPADTAISVESA